MENWQRKYVETNIQELETKTICTNTLLQQLEVDGVLANIEVESIKCCTTPVEKARTLYDIMICKKDGYAVILKALYTCHQIEPYKLLLLGYADCLSSDTHVEFLGKTKRLSEYFCDVEIQEIIQLARKKLSEDQCASNYVNIDISTTDWISLVRNTELPSTSLYIPRKLFKRVVINTKLFQEHYTDVFVFKGLQSLSNLSKLVHPQKTSSSSLQLRREKLSCRFILLENNEDWEKISSNAKVSCHLVKYEEDTKSCILEGTTGGSKIISQYLAKPSLKETGLSEDEFIETILVDSTSRSGYCICDSPGMGKTVLLSKIAEQLREKCADRLVAFISLSHFIQHLTRHNIPSNVDSAYARNALLEYLSLSPLSRCILDKLIAKFEVSMELFFDGFDEVDFKRVDFSKRLLKQLASRCPNTRVFVTSRTHMRYELEATLGAISYDIMPFTKVNQIEFLANSWLSEENEDKTNKEKLKDFACYCLESFEMGLTKDEQRITGIPLLCRILAKVYSRKAKYFCRSPVNTMSDVKNSFQFETSLAKLYREYIEESFKKLNSISNCSIADAKKYHTWTAFNILFPEVETEHFSKFYVKPTQHVLTSSISLGLMERKFIGNKEIVQFVHRNCTAEFFGECVKNLEHRSDSGDQVLNYLFKLLLSTKDISSADDIEESVFIYPVVVYFLNFFTKDLNIHSEALAIAQQFVDFVSPSNFRGILFGCFRENHSNIFKLIQIIFSQLEDTVKKRFRTEIIPDGETHVVTGFLNVSSVFSSISLVDALFAFFKDNFIFDLELFCRQLPLHLDTPLHFAIEKADVEKIQYFARIIPFQNRKLLLSCVVNSNEDTPQTVHRKVKMCRLLLSMDKSKELLAETAYTLHDSVHVEILKVLIEQGSDLDESKSEGNLVHQGAKYMSKEHIHELCRFLIDDIKAYHLFKRNELKWQSPLPSILRRPKSLRLLETIKLILDIPAINLTEKYENGNTLFHIAVEEKCCDKMLSLLENAGADVNALNTHNQTVLHLAAKSSYTCLIPFLIKRGVDCRQLDDLKNSFLHCLGTEATSAEEFHVIISLLASTGTTDVFHLKNALKQMPIHIAVRQIELKMETLQIFRSANVDFNSVDYENRSLLMYAAVGVRSVKFLTALIEFGANVTGQNLEGETFTHIISKFYSAEQYHELVKTIVSTGHREAFMVTDNLGRTPLYSSVFCLELLPETLKHLYDNMVNFNVADIHNQSLLWFATGGGRSMDFIKSLLEMGVDATIQRSDGATFAHGIPDIYSPKEYHDVTELLIGNGFGRVYQMVNQYGQTTIHLAVAQMQLQEETLHLIREKLVKTGTVEVNCTEENGHTILHAAIVGNSSRFSIRNENPLPILKWDGEEKNYLIYKSIEGASKSTRSHGKWDASHLKILIDMGVNITIQDKRGNTFAHYIPAFYSAERYHDILELLFQEGLAHVFQFANQRGETPLQTAILHLELLDKTLDLINSTLLQTNSVNVNRIDNNGDSILTVAVMGERSVRFLKTLLKLGVDPMIQNKDGNTFAHLGAAYYSPENYHKVVELIIKTHHEKVFQVVNENGQTPFHVAIIKLELLETTLQLIGCSVFETKVVDINFTNDDGNSFLMYAVLATRNGSFLEKLMKIGIDVTIRNKNGNTFAHLIATLCSPQDFHSLVKIILEENQERVLQIVNEKGQSPLHIAFAKLELLEETLDLANDALFQTNVVYVNLRDKDGKSLIVCAAIGKRNLNFMKKLLEMRANPSISDINGNNLAHYLPDYYTPREFHSMVQLLVQKGYDSIFPAVNKNETPALHLAIIKLELLDETLDFFNAAFFQANIANVSYTDQEGNSLLAYAVKGRKNVSSLEKLITMGVNPMSHDNDGNTFAHLIWEFYTPHDYHKILEMILRTGNEKVFSVANADNLTPLHFAIHQMELLEKTLDLVNASLFQTNIVDKNCTDVEGNSLLTYAVVGKRSVKCLEKMIKMGVDFTIQNKHGNTFAHLMPCAYAPQDYHNITQAIVQIGAQNVFQLVNDNGKTPLHVAIYNLELLDATLDLFKITFFGTNIIDINRTDKLGDTFLTYAVTGKRSVNFLHRLLEIGVDPTIQNVIGNTFAHLLPYHYTAEDYHKVVELLIRTENLNVFKEVNIQGQTPLHSAIEELELLEQTLELLSSEVFKPAILNINLTDSLGKSFLACAVGGKRSVKFLQKLSQMGVDPTILDEDGNNLAHLSPVYYTAYEYHKIVELIINSGQDSVFQAVNKNGQTPLHVAIQQLELEKETLNHFACSLFETKIVDINESDKNGNSLLVNALIGKRSFEQLENLLKLGLDPSVQNNDGDTFAHLCPRYYLPHEYHRIVELLMSVDRANVFLVQNNHGLTPLYAAVCCLELHVETLDLLVGIYMSINNEIYDNSVMSTSAHGLNTVGKWGVSILQCALRGKRSLEFVLHLVNLGANVFAKDGHGSTLAHTCASFGLYEHLKYFVGLGCDIDGLDNDGDNVLQCAVFDATENIFEIITFLVARGADIRHKNNEGKTAYQLAREKGITDERILNSLKEF